MKKSDGQRQADYLLLNNILAKYLQKALTNSSVAPRYLKLDTIDEIVMPFHEIKPLIHRVEWLKEDEYVDELLHFLAVSGLSEEELDWAVEMFALNKQDVLKRIQSRGYANE